MMIVQNISPPLGVRRFAFSSWTAAVMLSINVCIDSGGGTWDVGETRLHGVAGGDPGANRRPNRQNVTLPWIMNAMTAPNSATPSMSAARISAAVWIVPAASG